MEKVISIVTPSFNQAPFLERTISSVVSQAGHFYIDYNIMDGRSSDKSVEIIRGCEEELKRGASVQILKGLKFYRRRSAGGCLGISYRWVSERDGGQSAALNSGFQRAIGDIFAWVNSDDFYLEGVFQKVCNVFERHRADAVMGNTTAVDHLGRILWQQRQAPPSWFRLLYLNEGLPQPAVFFTGNLWRHARGVNESLHYTMDFDLWCRFLCEKARFVKLEEMCAVQTYHPGSKSCQGNTARGIFTPESVFKLFGPENERVNQHYRQALGCRHYWFAILLTLVEKHRYWNSRLRKFTVRPGLDCHPWRRSSRERIIQGRLVK
jgi:glycosyltransferase involved in cell wall biosynthesis